MLQLGHRNRSCPGKGQCLIPSPQIDLPAHQSCSAHLERYTKIKIVVYCMSPFIFTGLSGSFIFSQFYRNCCKLYANSDQTPHFEASDLGLHCSPISLLWNFMYSSFCCTIPQYCKVVGRNSPFSTAPVELAKLIPPLF